MIWMHILLCLVIATGLSMAQPPSKPKITGIAHVVLQARDFAASRSFYHDYLGYDEAFTLPKADSSIGTAFIKINECQYIELSPESEPDSDRLKYVAIETDNADRMRLDLRSKGIAVADSTPKGKTGNLNFAVKHPEGHSLKIVQYEPTGWTLGHKGKALAAQKAFYEDVLGFREIWRGSRGSQDGNCDALETPGLPQAPRNESWREPEEPSEFIRSRWHAQRTDGTNHHRRQTNTSVCRSTAGTLRTGII